MGQVFVSTIIPAPVDMVWSTLRAFDSVDTWAPRPGRSVEMEEGRAPDQVSALRLMKQGDETVACERLVAHSDVERSFTYELATKVDGFDIENYRATVRLAPVTADGTTFVYWTATFDCNLDRREHWEAQFRATFGGQAEGLAAFFRDRPV